jgi:uncharacterized repeat protein (TIGR01451 family)
MGMAAEAPVPLGRTSTFAVLAGSAITNTGNTVITGDAGGDVGVSAGTAISGFPPGTFSGTSHVLPDALAIGAHTDLVAARDNALSRTKTADVATELGGVTLFAGVYDGPALEISANQTLTLDAQGNPDAVFIIRGTSSLTVGTGAAVSLINGARYCRVFWVIPTQATLNADSRFVGHLFAGTQIEVLAGASVQGQLLAETAAVTLSNNRITNGLCATARELSITKTARDINGGSVMAGDVIEWTITVKNTGYEGVTGVIVRDTVPSETSYVTGSISGVGATAAGAPNLQWNVGNLASGAQVVLTFRSTVKDDLPSGTVIRNQGSVLSAQTALQLSNFATPTPRLPRTGYPPEAPTFPWQVAAAVAFGLALIAGASVLRPRRRAA